MFIKIFSTPPLTFREPRRFDCDDEHVCERPLVGRASVESADPEALVRGNARVIHYLLWVAALSPARLSPSALKSYCADIYAQHVGALGHRAFRRLFPGDSHFDRALCEAIAQFGSPAHCAIIAQAPDLTLRRAGARNAVELRERRRAGERLARLLDEAFADAEKQAPLRRSNAQWLRSQPLDVDDDDELQHAILVRVAEQGRATRAGESALAAPDDEKLRTAFARELCRQASRRWMGWRGCFPQRVATGPGRSIETMTRLVATSSGLCAAYFVEGRAILIDWGTMQGLGSLPLPF